MRWTSFSCCMFAVHFQIQSNVHPYGSRKLSAKMSVECVVHIEYVTAGRIDECDSISNQINAMMATGNSKNCSNKIENECCKANSNLKNEGCVLFRPIKTRVLVTTYRCLIDRMWMNFCAPMKCFCCCCCYMWSQCLRIRLSCVQVNALIWFIEGNWSYSVKRFGINVLWSRRSHCVWLDFMW